MAQSYRELQSFTLSIESIQLYQNSAKEMQNMPDELDALYECGLTYLARYSYSY